MRTRNTHTHTQHSSTKRTQALTHKAQQQRRRPHWARVLLSPHLGMSQTDVSASHTQWCSAPYLSHVDSLAYDLPEDAQQIWPFVHVAS